MILVIFLKGSFKNVILYQSERIKWEKALKHIEVSGRFADFVGPVFLLRFIVFVASTVDFENFKSAPSDTSNLKRAKVMEAKHSHDMGKAVACAINSLVIELNNFYL